MATDTTTVEPTTMPEESTTMPEEPTTEPTTMPEESTTIPPPTTTTVTTTTTMIPTVKPCPNNRLNRTDMVLGEVCGQYGVDGRCTVLHSACMQSKTDTSWKCRCSQGYAKQNQQCVAMPIKLFSSGQPVMVTVQKSATSGFTIKSINFDEVSGFDVSNPTAEIKGPESPLFKVPVNTTDVILKLDGSLDRLNYVIFVTVSVTIDNVLIRDFVEVRISVSSQGVIGKNIVILHGTPKGSIIGQICTSCITGSDVISVSNSDVYDVNMEGSVFTTKPINLDTLQSTMTIFNSTYILVYKNTNLIANVTIIVIRSQYTVTLDEGSGSNTQVALLNDIFQTFKINTDGLGTSGDVINLGNITLNYEEQTEVTKTLSFSNPTGIMDPFDILVTIKIQDVNDVQPQFQQKPYNFLAVQSSYKNLIVGVVKADDPDMSSMLTYSITPNDILLIDEQGVIKTNQTIPRSIYTAMVTVSDGRYFDTVAIVVNLLLPTTTNLQLEFTGTILENANLDTMIKNVSINGYKNYQFTDQAAYNDLSLDSVTGLVKSVRSYDRENVQERQFKFTIVGNRENEVSCSLVIIGEITVNVIDVNDEPPVFINTPYTATVVEESSEEQLKMNIPMDTTDKDVNPTVSYSLVNHEDEFDINSLSGIIKTKVNINRETTPSLSISVNASDGVNSVTAVIVVTIEDINDNSPSFTSTPYNFAVDENSQIGKSVGTISANDSDIGKNAEITYQIHSDGGYFRINQTTGEITISRNLDREMNSTHKPIVYARDNGDIILSSSVIVTISVNDINDNAPFFSSDRIMVEFEENKDCSNIITNLTATDSDSPNSTNSRITYSLLSGSDDFQIDPSTGSLRCLTMLNYENITSYTLLVKAQDNGSPTKLSSNKTVIINVKDINDNTPKFVKAKNSMTIRYFGKVQRVIEVLNVVDLDYGANGMVNITISGSAAAFLTIDNKGILKTIASNKPSDGLYSLTITATDMGSPTLSSSHSMNVTVSQLSTPPITFSKQEINMNITENSNIGTEIGTISTEVTKPSGTNVTFEIIDEKADIKFSLNSDDGKVTLKGSIDREENEFHEFVVRVKNKTNDDQSDLALVTVQILDENDNKPIFDRDNFYFEIKEDSSSDTMVNPTEVKVIATDADIGMNAEIKYKQLESVGCAAVFTFKENSIVLTGTIDYEVYTFCKLTVKAYNPNNETMSSTVNVHINVLDVNDNPPEFHGHTNNVYTVSVREDTTINTVIPAFGLLEDKDSRENGDIELSTVSSCLFDVRRNYDKIQLQVKPNTILDYESSIHVNTCIIKAIDKGAPPLNATATLSISITDVNDNRPNITSPNTNVNVSRDAKVGHVIISQIHATDADSSENGELRYSLQNSQYYSKFIIDPATGRIAINSPLRSVQTDKITLMAIVSDKGIPPLSSAVVVTILITDDNPRPYLEQTPVINIQEHTQRPNDGEIVRVKAYDGVNANGVVKVCDCTFKLDTNRVDLKIDNDSGIVRFKNKDDSFDREKEYNSKVFVSVIASDKYDPPKDSDPMIITINILDINDQYPRFTQDIYHFKVYQKAPNGVQIGTVIAIDKDLAPDTRYSINITESSFSSSVVSINETTGEITKSGDMTLTQTGNTQIKGWVYAQDNKDLSKQPPDSKQITITIEFDDKNNHTPTFQLEKYNTDMQWDAEVEQSIVQTMATDADSGVEGTISYSLVEGNSRGFFKIDNTGMLMLAYKLDSSIGTDATEIVTLTVKAMDGGIIPKYSSVQIIIRISGNNPGACIQGTEHSKQVLDITEERNNWSYAMYALVALLCIAIVCSLFFLYKWRTTPVPTISHPVDKDGKNKYLSSGSDYSDLGKRNTVEYSHSNQGFDPLSMLNPDPYSTVCDNDLHVATSKRYYRNAFSDDAPRGYEPRPDYPDDDYKSAPAGVMFPFPSTFNASA